jgi:hypothetical protein
MAGSAEQTIDRRRRLPRARWFVVGGVVAVLAVVVFWFEPQALFIDKRVADPVPAAKVAAEPAVPTAAPGPVELGSGELISLDHGTSGRVRVLELTDGARYVRLEGLRTENGPAVRVYLSANPAHGPEGAFDDAFVDLGELQGNLGDQNYRIPDEVDPLSFASVVIWCERFDSAFGAADLTSGPIRR